MSDLTYRASRYNLSASEDWRAVLTSFDFNDGFDFIVLLVTDEDGAEVCRQALLNRLQGEGKSLLEIPVGTVEQLEDVANPLIRGEASPDTGAVWVSRVVHEVDPESPRWKKAWALAVRRLNRFRNPFRRVWKVPVVFVGAPWLQEVLRDNAPDLWSVRTTVARIEPTPVPEPAVTTPQPARPPVATGPDPGMALAEVERLRARSAAPLSIARMFYRAGLGFAARYQWIDAKHALENCLRIRLEATASAEDVADTRYQLAQVLRWLAEYESAKAQLEAALVSYRQLSSVRGEARCIQGLGDIAFAQSNFVEARKQYETAALLYHQAGFAIGEANCIGGLGDIALACSDYKEARTRYEQAQPLFRHLGDTLGEANCIRGLGDVALRLSDHIEARSRYQTALPLFRRVGSVLGEANCIFGLAEAALARADLAEARSCYESALPLYQKVGDILGEANCVHALGHVALAQLEYAEAKLRYESSLPLYRRAGNVRGEAHSILGLGNIASAQGKYAEARARYESALPLYRQLDDAVGEANCVLRLGDLARGVGDTVQAQACYRRSVLLYESVSERYSIGRVHLRLARFAADPAERARHIEAAREAWQSIGRPDLIKELDAESGSIQ